MDKTYTNPIWHPFTQMASAAAPIHIESAKGCILFGQDGKTYIDAVSSWWVNIHGHANPMIAQRIAEQALKLEHVIFAGFTHTPAIDLANALLRILPDSMAKIFFSDNGSTAVEVAIKMALQYWYNQGVRNKTKIIAFENAYHGDTFGAMSVGGRGAFNAAFAQHLFHVDYIPVPNADNILHVQEQFEALTASSEVAAFIFEPLVQGAGGMLMHKAEHLDQLVQMARQKKVLCIADEVMTGFGRTGKNFATEYLSNQADIMCLSKGITGGFMPLGVTACSQDIFNSFYAMEVDKTFFHGHSYTGNPLACAAANASMDILVSEDCQNNIKAIGLSHARFAETLKNEVLIKDIRQQGTILAIELKTAEGSSYFNHIRDEIYQFSLAHGVLLRPLGNIIYIMPPYCILQEELEKIYEVITLFIHHLNSKKN